MQFLEGALVCPEGIGAKTDKPNLRERALVFNAEGVDGGDRDAVMSPSIARRRAHSTTLAPRRAAIFRAAVTRV